MLAPSSAKIRRERSPQKEAISRYDCARQQAQSTRRMPLKAPINADNRRYRSLDFRFEEFLRTRRTHVGLGDKGYPGIDIG